MRMSIPIIAASLLLLSTTVFARDANYSFLEVSLGQVDSDGIDGDSIGVGGAIEVGEQFYFTGGYSQTGYDYDIDQDILGAGVGIHGSLGVSTDVYAELLLIQVDIDTDFGSADDNGHAINLGIRHFVNDNFELNAEFGSVDIFDDSETGFTIGGRGYSGNFSVGFFYTKADESDGITLALRTDF